MTFCLASRLVWVCFDTSSGIKAGYGWVMFWNVVSEIYLDMCSGRRLLRPLQIQLALAVTSGFVGASSNDELEEQE